jgi:hypothetical protein
MGLMGDPELSGTPGDPHRFASRHLYLHACRVLLDHLDQSAHRDNLETLANQATLDVMVKKVSLDYRDHQGLKETLDFQASQAFQGMRAHPPSPHLPYLVIRDRPETAALQDRQEVPGLTGGLESRAGLGQKVHVDRTADPGRLEPLVKQVRPVHLVLVARVGFAPNIALLMVGFSLKTERETEQG